MCLGLLQYMYLILQITKDIARLILLPRNNFQYINTNTITN